MTQQPETQPSEMKITVLDSPPGRHKPRPAQRGPKPKSPSPATGDHDGATDKTPEDDAVSMEDAEIGVDGPPDAGSPADAPAPSIVATPDKLVDKSVPKSRPPTVDEWQDFIGRIVLRTLLDGYVTLMLRDCDLTAQEEKYIELSKADLKEMAAPFASFASKNKTMQKHGRAIISASDSYEAIIGLTIWMRRVNKVAKRHRPEQAAAARNRQAAKGARPQHTHVAQSPSPAPQQRAEQAVNPSGPTGQAEQDGVGPRPSPPPVEYLGNPGTG